MSNIIKRGKNSFRLIVELGYDTKGNRIRRTKTVKVSRKSDAEIEMARFQMEIESKEYIAPEKFVFKDFCEEWKTKFVEKHLEGKTIEGYLHHLKRRILPFFEDMRMDKIKTLHIEQFLTELQQPGMRLDGKPGTLSQAMIVYSYRVLRSIFTKALEWRVIKDNPMTGVKKPKEDDPEELEPYNEQEVMVIFEALQSEPLQFRVMITLALVSGMRRGELIGLEKKNLNLPGLYADVKQAIAMNVGGQPVIKAPKTKSSVRRISLPISIVPELDEHLTSLEQFGVREHAFVFTNPYGGSLAPKTPSDQWRSFIKRNPAIRYIRFHDLRHTSVSLLINQNVHAKIISKRIGHAKIGTTMNVYGHIFRAADHAAADTFNVLFKPKTTPEPDTE